MICIIIEETTRNKADVYLPEALIEVFPQKSGCP
jgi:hypothetical protein